MKKVILVAASVTFLFTVSCKKSEGGNKEVIQSESSESSYVDNNGKIDSTSTASSMTEVNGEKTEKISNIYKATDGTLVKVIFETTPKESTLSIRNNNKTFILKKTGAAGNETTYTKDDMTAKVTQDSIHLIQGNNVIELKKTKI
ncbi:hypothetical protein QE422_004021 [Chryseobacterium sp. SORGH_AS 447]|uniref:hypothetical protein n=1 Tax=Chryseobacterium sp. SORGH_AS_0447 TaxID=3041769 RepID=UPI0027806A92|nr:hypothetical protein [Chryseobacterium sp. SORGH_AS_0447]MDQ1163653.1 hypothetical protein [Chryseobacterium sp. SORGH_AS_0447]